MFDYITGFSRGLDKFIDEDFLRLERLLSEYRDFMSRCTSK